MKSTHISRRTKNTSFLGKAISIIIVALFLSALAGCVTTGGYSTHPEYVAQVVDRTTFHKRESVSSFNHFQGNSSASEFQKNADRKLPVVINVHGCGGVGFGILEMGVLGNELGMHVLIPDFLRRDGVTATCGNSPSSVTREVANYSRINARRHEIDYLIRWLRKSEFETIFVVGHSEGGRTVQGVKELVNGVVISGMDCRAPRFWSPNPQNPLLVLVSARDEWLTHWSPGVVSCERLLNGHTAHAKEVISDGHSHRPTPLWDKEANAAFTGFIEKFR